MEFGSVTLKRIGFFVFQLNTQHTPFPPPFFSLDTRNLESLGNREFPRDFRDVDFTFCFFGDKYSSLACSRPLRSRPDASSVLRKALIFPHIMIIFPRGKCVCFSVLCNRHWVTVRGGLPCLSTLRLTSRPKRLPQRLPRCMPNLPPDRLCLLYRQCCTAFCATDGCFVPLSACGFSNISWWQSGGSGGAASS